MGTYLGWKIIIGRRRFTSRHGTVEGEEEGSTNHGRTRWRTIIYLKLTKKIVRINIIEYFNSYDKKICLSTRAKSKKCYKGQNNSNLKQYLGTLKISFIYSEGFSSFASNLIEEGQEMRNMNEIITLCASKTNMV